MPRAKSEEIEFGSDSFLDVVANIVGILIILIIAVGIRASREPLAAAMSAKPRPSPAELRLQRNARALKQENAQAVAQAIALEQSAAASQAQQAGLAELIEQYQQELAEQHAAEAAAAGREQDTKYQVAVAASYLARLEQELAQAENAEPEAIQVECYPTPISRVVTGKEAHFQLRGGRLAQIPLDELIAKLKSEAMQQMWKLRDLPEATDTIGPLGGFRMRYTMERVDVQGEGRMAGAQVGSYAQLAEWTLVPVAGQMGETVEQCLAANSDFRMALARLDPQSTTITIWTYPDSFAEFRQLKAELYKQGYATAARPLPEGQPIGGSPNGSKSTAQ